MSKDDCVFCKMVAGQIPVTKIYENESVLCFLDINPLSEGHTLLIPKEHFEKLDDIPTETLANVVKPLGRIAAAVKKAVDSDGYNILNNNGPAAGQVVNHVHFHIIPRNEGDGIFTQWAASKYPKGRMEQLAEKIRVKL